MKTLTKILFSSILMALSLPLAAQNTEGGDDFDAFFSNAVSRQQQQQDTVVQEPAPKPGFLESLLGRRRPGRRQIEQENELLRSELDSLQMLVDSLRGQGLDPYELAVLEGNDPDQSADQFEYTQETSDSLLHLWYKNSFITDFDAVNEYNMDSVRFSSNVSDAEMMRRLAAMNSFISLPYNDVVKNYIILYSERMTSRMGRVMGLSAYYFPIFEDILVRYDLPQELKYMAIIESMLNPVATSRAGARGIWQFMYQTARGYGLEINSFVGAWTWRRPLTRLRATCATPTRSSATGPWPSARTTAGPATCRRRSAARTAGATSGASIPTCRGRRAATCLPSWARCTR